MAMDGVAVANVNKVAVSMFVLGCAVLPLPGIEVVLIAMPNCVGIPSPNTIEKVV